MTPKTQASSATRILMHSHDSFGLGHLRRTLTIAERLARDIEGACVLVTTGSPCATHFELPGGVDVLKLPSVTKDGGGAHVPRGLSSLDLVDRLRRNVLREVLDSFKPQLLIADHQPVGLRGELMDVLLECRRSGVRTVLGMRDIIDEPERVAVEWSTAENRRALESLYDRVVVYGSPEVFDARFEYPLPPELKQRIEFVGYVARTVPDRRNAANLRPQVLVTLGGGEDGEDRAMADLEALGDRQTPWDSTLVLGPLMDRQRGRHIKRTARRMPGVRVRSYYSDLPRLLTESDAAVSMAGYNTVAEIMATRTKALLLPRTHPRREQQIRAQRLEELGLALTVHDDSPEKLYEAVSRTLSFRPNWGRLPPLDGDLRMSGLVRGLLGQPSSVCRVAAQ